MGDPATSGTGRAVEMVLHASVATLYNNLVTRPTGRAVRVAIEQQIQGTRGTCLSILDFSQVGVLDFSCADEVIAKLLRRYRAADRPSEAFFVVQGVAEHHREPIEAVLQRHNLLLVAVQSGQPALWGPAPTRLRRAWDCLGKLGHAYADEFASARGLSTSAASSWLKRLVTWRVAVPEGSERFSSLPAVLGQGAAYRSVPIDARPPAAAAEDPAPYHTGTDDADRSPPEAADVGPQYPPQAGETGQLPAW